MCGPEGEDALRARREAMVRHIERHGVADAAVLAALRKVRRHVYVPEAHRGHADPYGDYPFPIGEEQTISQPYVVAYMTAKMNIRAGVKALEIGTGSGYQAAILAELGAKVYTVERIPELAEHARCVLQDEGYGGVRTRIGDGYQGWPEAAPFDVVLVTCAPERVPDRLVAQLADGGRMIVPVGRYGQRLVILRRQGERVHREEDLPVRFVPMVGKDRP